MIALSANEATTNGCDYVFVCVGGGGLHVEQHMHIACGSQLAAQKTVRNNSTVRNSSFGVGSMVAAFTCGNPPSPCCAAVPS
jgi:hypothetical protein